MNKTETPTYYPVYSLSMTNYLVRCGCDIVKVDDNEKDTKYKRFLFYDGFKLRKASASYKKQEV